MDKQETGLEQIEAATAVYNQLLANEKEARANLEKLGFELLEVADITQGKLEAWDRFYHASKSNEGRNTDAGNFTRASIKAKWFVDEMSPMIVDVKNMKAWQIRMIQDAINAVYMLAVTPDPNF